MSFRQETATRIHREFPAYFRNAILKQAYFFTPVAETQLHVMHQLVDGESVMKFADLYVFGSQASHLIGFMGAFVGHVGEGHVVSAK